MTNKKPDGGPAFPTRHWMGAPRPDGSRPIEDIPGLTKRELFAAMAMVGFLVESRDSAETDAEVAVRAADALIAELEK